QPQQRAHSTVAFLRTRAALTVATQRPARGTPSPTPTASPTPTPSATASPTPTPTPTASATFTPTPTPTPTPTVTPCGNIIQSAGTIVPGGTDIGNHGDDVVTTVVLPFSYTACGQTYTSINLSS